MKLLERYRTLLIRYHYHGYGNPADDMGIVIFANDRVVLQEVVAHIPSRHYFRHKTVDFSEFRNVQELKEFYAPRSTARVRKLIEQVNAKYVR